MIRREESRSYWRQRLSLDCLQQISTSVSIAIFVNNNKVRIGKQHRGNRTDAFANEKALVTSLLGLINDTLSDARLALKLIPYSTMMLEDPKNAITELLRWSEIVVEAIEVRSCLETRMEAASYSMYWPASANT